MSKVLARSRNPILEASAAERRGYVPNVVYSCGGMVRDRMLLPCGVADIWAGFATAPIDGILGMLS